MWNHVKPEQPWRNNNIQKVTVSTKHWFGFFSPYKGEKTGWELGTPKAQFYCLIIEIRVWKNPTHNPHTRAVQQNLEDVWCPHSWVCLVWFWINGMSTKQSQSPALHAGSAEILNSSLTPSQQLPLCLWNGHYGTWIRPSLPAQLLEFKRQINLKANS